jgi:hypothetical protein
LPNKAQSRREKVSAMASAQWYKTNPFVAFPIDALFSPSGAFVGFAMKKVGGHKPIHMLYSPASRKLQFHKANYQFLIRAASNISKAVAFVSSDPGTYIPTSIDVAQITAIINAIRDPGAMPNLQTVLSPASLHAAAPSVSLNSKLKTRAFGGIAASAAGTVLICFGGGAVWPGVLILGAGIMCNVVIPPELKKLRQERSQASSSWRIVQDAWTRQPGNKQYLEIKRAAEDLIRALADLPNEERRGI